MSKTMAPPIERLLSTGEVDRLFRLREGTAYALCRAGRIRCAKRSIRGRDAFFVSPTDANTEWGPK